MRQVSTTIPPAAAVLEAFGIDPDSLEPSLSGLINQTWLARGSGQRALVLQRLNPIFSAQVNRDIDVVTQHLLGKGIAAPALIRTLDGALWFEQAGEVWRALTRVEGVCHEAAEHSARVREAARVLGEFHRGVDDLEHDFENVRLGVHDTAKHLRALQDVLEQFEGHPEYATVAPLARDIRALGAELPPLPKARDRIVHGDPKIANVLFKAGKDQAICLIDFDTLGRMPIALELGDALRSWCNPASEEAANATFSMELFRAAIEGYADITRGWLEPAEWQAIPGGTLTIAVELAARFCADALRESYFGWNPNRFATASLHNQARARGQLAIARTLRAELPEMQRLVAATF